MRNSEFRLSRQKYFKESLPYFVCSTQQIIFSIFSFISA